MSSRGRASREDPPPSASQIMAEEEEQQQQQQKDHSSGAGGAATAELNQQQQPAAAASNRQQSGNNRQGALPLPVFKDQVHGDDDGRAAAPRTISAVAVAVIPTAQGVAVDASRLSLLEEPQTLPAAVLQTYGTSSSGRNSGSSRSRPPQPLNNNRITNTLSSGARGINAKNTVGTYNQPPSSNNNTNAAGTSRRSGGGGASSSPATSDDRQHSNNATTTAASEKTASCAVPAPAASTITIRKRHLWVASIVVVVVIVAVVLVLVVVLGGSSQEVTDPNSAQQQQQKLIASDGHRTDRFGFSLAMDGDVLVVGANLHHSNNLELSGAAYIFVRWNTNTAWTQQFKLMASDAARGDRFGSAVAIASGGSTIIVSAPLSGNSNFNDTGTAYIFVRNGDNWTEQARLRDADAGANDQFGSCVALSSNMALVGLRGNRASSRVENDLGRVGSIYIFVPSNDGSNTWTQQMKLMASDGIEEDFFGGSVAIDRDTVVVGAHLVDNAEENSGSAYVYILSGTVWTEHAKLIANDGNQDDYFGLSVAIDGDTIVVGAPTTDFNSIVKSSGSVYVFVNVMTMWTEQAILMASNNTAGSSFGSSVDVQGDTIVIGADEDDNNVKSDESGSCYIFTRSGAVWTEQAKIKARDRAANDSFGNQVSISDDTVSIGSHRNNNENGETAGSVYIVDLQN